MTAAPSRPAARWAPRSLPPLLLCAAAAAASPPGFGGQPSALDLTRWRNKRLMVIGAHPDDAEFFAGGTIAALREQQLNVSVAYLVVTNGNAGGRCYNDSTGEPRPADQPCEPEELAFVRRREMLAAGSALGVESVWRCGFDDGMLLSYHESAVRERISAYVRRFRPHVVLTHYPYPNFEAPQTCNGACPAEAASWGDLGYHPDHKHVGWHVMNACYGGGSSADNEHLFGELSGAGGLRPWKTEQLYFFALTAAQPITHYVPLTDANIAAKGGALAQHRSQYPSPPTASVEWVAGVVAREAGATGSASYAEGFQGFF